MSGGVSTGPAGGGGGFVQGTNPFGGLTNTDLRPGRRRRPVPLLNTSWVLNRRKRRKGHDMRKDIAALLETLQKSLAGIADSGAENREELLTKSMQQFEEHLLDLIGPAMPFSEEDLAQEHPVVLFHHSLTKLAADLEMIKAAAADAGMDDPFDRLLAAGTFTLRSLASDSTTPIETRREYALAERAGTLVKILSFDGDDLLVKSDLPPDLHEFILDPMDLMADSVEVSRSFLDVGLDLAEPLVKAELIPEEFAASYPELFEPLEKAASPFPPKKKPFGATAAAPPDPTADAGGGDDPDDGADTAGADGGQDMGDTAGDDATQNPIETALRLNSICVVLLGSILQAQGQDPNGQAMPSGQDTGAGGGVPLQRSIPLEDVPLAKILSGEVAVSNDLADALEERETLRKQVLESTTERNKAIADLAKMQKTLAQLQKQAIPDPKGAVFQVDKSGETRPTGAVDTATELGKLEKMAVTDPERASREAMKMIHATGGVPIIATDAVVR